MKWTYKVLLLLIKYGLIFENFFFIIVSNIVDHHSVNNIPMYDKAIIVITMNLKVGYSSMFIRNFFNSD